jgi:hypothetical protein
MHGVECTENLLYIIQRRSTRRDFSFVIYHSTAYCGAYPKFIIYHPAPIDSMCFFFCCVSIICLLWSVHKIYYISSNADQSDSRFSFVIHQSTAYTAVESAQNLVYIIQRRSERLALFVCYISINCLYCSGE